MSVPIADLDQQALRTLVEGGIPEKEARALIDDVRERAARAKAERQNQSERSNTMKLDRTTFGDLKVDDWVMTDPYWGVEKVLAIYRHDLNEYDGAPWEIVRIALRAPGYGGYGRFIARFPTEECIRAVPWTIPPTTPAQAAAREARP